MKIESAPAAPSKPTGFPEQVGFLFEPNEGYQMKGSRVKSLRKTQAFHY